jgi:pimeloyl-ACP methyl ester carboxylesterase
MDATAGSFTEETVEVAQSKLRYLKGGTGRPLVVLHGIEGPEGWLAFHEAVSKYATIYAPALPGYGESERPDWLETIPHTALVCSWFLQELGLSGVDLVGIGVGGWVAAEMAVMAPQALRHLVLAGAAGLKPTAGQALDVFTIPWRDVIDRSFHDPQSSAEYQRIYGANPIVDFGGHREAGRSTAMRTCYRPYMYDPALLPMLGRVSVPALVVWGDDDRVIPLDCAHQYTTALPDARLEVIDGCGHWPHYEQPAVFAEIVREFIST